MAVTEGQRSRCGEDMGKAAPMAVLVGAQDGQLPWRTEQRRHKAQHGVTLGPSNPPLGVINVRNEGRYPNMRLSGAAPLAGAERWEQLTSTVDEGINTAWPNHATEYYSALRGAKAGFMSNDDH